MRIDYEAYNKLVVERDNVQHAYKKTLKATMGEEHLNLKRCASRYYAMYDDAFQKKEFDLCQNFLMQFYQILDQVSRKNLDQINERRDSVNREIACDSASLHHRSRNAAAPKPQLNSPDAELSPPGITPSPVLFQDGRIKTPSIDVRSPIDPSSQYPESPCFFRNAESQRDLFSPTSPSQSANNQQAFLPKPIAVKAVPGMPSASVRPPFDDL